MEGEVPRREPRVLPLVWHGDDVFSVQVLPLVIAERRIGEQRVPAVFRQPDVPVELVVLLGPEHAGQRLAADHPLVAAEIDGQYVGVELVRLGPAGVHHVVEVVERVPGLSLSQPHPDPVAFPGRNVQDVVQRRLGPGAIGVDRGGFAVHDGPVDPVLNVGGVVRRVENELVVGLIAGHQDGHLLFCVQPARPERGVVSAHGAAAWPLGVGAERGVLGTAGPGPRVPEPERGQHVHPGRFRPPVVHGDFQENVLGRGFRVFHEDVEVPVLVKDPGIDKLIFRIVFSACGIGRDQVTIGKFALRVLVQHLQVGRRRGRVEVVIAFLDVFAVVALAVGEAEQPLLEYLVTLVPQAQRQAQQLLVVADAGQPVLAPAVSPGPGLVVGERVPRVVALASVLADRPPLPFAEIGAPAPPRDTRRVGFFHSPLLCVAHIPRRPVVRASRRDRAGPHRCQHPQGRLLLPHLQRVNRAGPEACPWPVFGRARYGW